MGRNRLLFRAGRTGFGRSVRRGDKGCGRRPRGPESGIPPRRHQRSPEVPHRPLQRDPGAWGAGGAMGHTFRAVVRTWLDARRFRCVGSPGRAGHRSGRDFPRCGLPPSGRWSMATAERAAGRPIGAPGAPPLQDGPPRRRRGVGSRLPGCRNGRPGRCGRSPARAQLCPTRRLVDVVAGSLTGVAGRCDRTGVGAQCSRIGTYGPFGPASDARTLTSDEPVVAA